MTREQQLYQDLRGVWHPYSKKMCRFIPHSVTIETSHGSEVQTVRHPVGYTKASKRTRGHCSGSLDGFKWRVDAAIRFYLK